MPNLPKPFHRPTIDLGATKRVWATVPVTSIRIGDTVPDIGVVLEIKRWESHDYVTRTTVFRFIGPELQRDYPIFDSGVMADDATLVFAFVEPDRA